MKDRQSGFEIMTEPFVDVTDVWPPGTLTEASVQAYKLLAARGRIEIRRIVTGPRSGATRISYLAMEMEPMARRAELLAAKRDALALTGRVEQQALALNGCANRRDDNAGA